MKKFLCVALVAGCIAACLVACRKTPDVTTTVPTTAPTTGLTTVPSTTLSTTAATTPTAEVTTGTVNPTTIPTGAVTTVPTVPTQTGLPSTAPTTTQGATVPTTATTAATTGVVTPTTASTAPTVGTTVPTGTVRPTAAPTATVTTAPTAPTVGPTTQTGFTSTIPTTVTVQTRPTVPTTGVTTVPTTGVTTVATTVPAKPTTVPTVPSISTTPTTVPSVPTTPTTVPGLTLPYTIPGTGLIVEQINAYDGIYVEDGSNAQIEGVAMILLHNRGKKDIDLATVTLTYGEFTREFVVSSLPKGMSVVVQEKNKKAMGSGKLTDCSATVIESSKDMQISPYEISVTENGDNSLTIKNLTQKDLPSVRIFYKYFMTEEQLLVGGITFTVNVTDLKAGQSITVKPAHYLVGASQIVMVQTYEDAV